MNKYTVKKNIEGILLLDKPLTLTSNAALQSVKRLFGARKAGHTGSLDPLATGMLPLCFGEATKFSQFLLESDKHYQVTIQLGVKTTTGDAEGEVIATRPVENITWELLERLLLELKGPMEQIPPMYSAIKFQGQPLYKLARQGIEIERKSRLIQLHELRLDALQDDVFSLYVHCSKGTYVRTLAEDIGEKLGCGAHVSGLRRVSVSPYLNEKMYTLSALEEMHKQYGPDALKQCLLPIETSVQDLPSVKLSSSAAFYIRTGQAVMVPHAPVEGAVRIFSDTLQFMGVGEITDDGRVAPRRLVASSPHRHPERSEGPPLGTVSLNEDLSFV